MLRKPDVAAAHYLRALAALTVTVHHLTLGAGAPAVGLGRLGVDVFFVLSGFIVPYAMWHHGYRVSHYPRFIAKRLLRLEPAYVASMALTVVLAYAAAQHLHFRGSTPDFTIWQLFAHLCYAIPATGHDWVNITYWTLAYEFAFYLAIGLLFPLCVRSGRLFAATGVVSLMAVHISFGSGVELHRVALFFFGLAAFRAFVGLDTKEALALHLGLGCLVMLGSPQAAESTHLAHIAATIVIGLVTAMWLLMPLRQPGRWILFFSQISYSLYLLHVPIGNRVVHLGERIFPGLLGDICAIAAGLIASTLAAYLWYRIFELPALRLSKRLGYAPVQTGALPFAAQCAASR